MELTCQNIIHDLLWFPCHARFIDVRLLIEIASRLVPRGRDDGPLPGVEVGRG